MSSKQIGAESHFGRLFNDGTYGDAQWWIKQRDYESLRRRFEKACARITELESATETQAPHDITCNYRNGPLFGPGCICKVVNKHEHATDSAIVQTARAVNTAVCASHIHTEWFPALSALRTAIESSVKAAAPPASNRWIACAERMPTYADGKGRDMSVLGWLTDIPGDWSNAGACSVSYFNVEGWVKENKCRYWTHLPDGPSEKTGGER